MDTLASEREKLPIFNCKADILGYIAKIKTIIFVGETGSGKTTQVPQYLLEAGLARHKCIGITQPRRVGAISVAKRVAREVGTELGAIVGYSIRFENVTSADTKIKYLTDGMLLRETIHDKLLLNYSIIILDEAHERTLNNDILLGIVKSAQRSREQKHLVTLKIIVMSATLDCQHFSKYFDDCPVFSIPGRCYNVQILQPTKKQSHYVRAALATVFKIHQFEDEGDILVFATGQDEIDCMVYETTETAKYLPTGIGPIFPCALYAALPFDKQVDVFKPVIPGGRKVIFATNIAETSITIPKVKYVVDTGKVKAKSCNSVRGFDVLLNEWVSKAQAIQRAGRAGRESDGKCYRLYTDEQYRSFKEQTQPEILRSCLSSVVLQMIAWGIGNVAKFDFIDKPPPENIAAAINTLKNLDAVVEKNGLLELTECGNKMAKFPLDPRYSKIIIESKKYRCTDEILTIISLLCVESIFYVKLAEKEQFAKTMQKFEKVEGDLLMMLEIYKQYKKMKKNQAWCQENFINSQNIKKCMAIRKQLNAICMDAKVDIPQSSCNDKARIIKCLATGLFMNVALLHERTTYKTMESNQEIKIHPTSCLFKKNNLSCCMYTELVQTTQVFMRNVTYIPEELLLSVKRDYIMAKMSQVTKKPTVSSS